MGPNLNHSNKNYHVVHLALHRTYSLVNNDSCLLARLLLLLTRLRALPRRFPLLAWQAKSLLLLLFGDNNVGALFPWHLRRHVGLRTLYNRRSPLHLPRLFIVNANRILHNRGFPNTNFTRLTHRVRNEGRYLDVIFFRLTSGTRIMPSRRNANRNWRHRRNGTRPRSSNRNWVRNQYALNRGN